MKSLPRRMTSAELAAWRIRNPDYLYPRTLRPDWQPPPEWGDPVYRSPIERMDGQPPRQEFLLFQLPPGVTPHRRDFQMVFPGQVLVTRALPRTTAPTDMIEENNEHP